MKLRFLFLAALLFAAVPLAAQSQSKAAPDSSGKSGKFDVRERQQDMKMFLDKIEILGRIDKPQTVFIVPGKDPKVEDIQIDRAFYQEIFRQVEWDRTRKVLERKARQSKKR